MGKGNPIGTQIGNQFNGACPSLDPAIRKKSPDKSPPKIEACHLQQYPALQKINEELKNLGFGMKESATKLVSDLLQGSFDPSKFTFADPILGARLKFLNGAMAHKGKIELLGSKGDFLVTVSSAINLGEGESLANATIQSIDQGELNKNKFTMMIEAGVCTLVQDTGEEDPKHPCQEKPEVHEVSKKLVGAMQWFMEDGWKYLMGHGLLEIFAKTEFKRWIFKPLGWAGKLYVGIWREVGKAFGVENYFASRLSIWKSRVGLIPGLGKFAWFNNRLAGLMTRMEFIPRVLGVSVKNIWNGSAVLGRQVGNAAVVALGFDAALAALGVDKDAAIRKYGSAAIVTSPLVDKFILRGMGSGAVKALAAPVVERILASSFGAVLARVGAQFAVKGASRALIPIIGWVSLAADWGTALYLDKYEKSVNERAVRRFKDENFTGFWGTTAGIFYGAGEFLLGSAADNYTATIMEDDLRIRREDANVSRAYQAGLKAWFVENMVQSDSGLFDPTDPKSYQSLDLIFLQQAAPEEDFNTSFKFNLLKMKLAMNPEMNSEEILDFMEMDEVAFKHFMHKHDLHEMQAALKFMVFVDQDLNNWVRNYFDKEGLWMGNAPEGLKTLLGGSKESEILMVRKGLVAQQFLSGVTTIGGKPAHAVAKAAGIIDAQGHLLQSKALASVMQGLLQQQNNPEMAAVLRNVKQLVAASFKVRVKQKQDDKHFDEEELQFCVAMVHDLGMDSLLQVEIKPDPLVEAWMEEANQFIAVPE